MLRFIKSAGAFLLSSIILLSFSSCKDAQTNKVELQSSSQVEQSSQTTETSSEPAISKMDGSAKSSVNQPSEKNQKSSMKQTASNSNTSQVIIESSSDPSSSIDQSKIERGSSTSSFLDQHDFCIDELTRKQRVILKQYAHSIKLDSENWDNWDKKRSYEELLKTKLDPNHYLGFNYDFESVGLNYEFDLSFIIIKIVNLDNVKTVVSSYPPDPFKVLYEKAEYSLADLKAIEQEFKDQPFYKNNPSSIHTNIKDTGIIEYKLDNMYPELDKWLENSGYKDLFVEVDGSVKILPD